MEGTVDSQVSHVSIRFIGQILCKIDNSEIGTHVFPCNVLNPRWNCCRKEADLDATSNLRSNFAENLVDILFKTKLEHHISLVKDKRLHLGEVDVSSLNVIKNSSSGSNKKIDSTSKLVSLVVNWNTTIHSHNSELLRCVLQLG